MQLANAGWIFRQVLSKAGHLRLTSLGKLDVDVVLLKLGKQ